MSLLALSRALGGAISEAKIDEVAFGFEPRFLGSDWMARGRNRLVVVFWV